MADAGRKKTDVLGLQTKLSKIGRYRSIDLGDIKKYRLDRTVMATSIQTKILNSLIRKMERLFNCIPGHIRDIKERPTAYFNPFRPIYRYRYTFFGFL